MLLIEGILGDARAAPFAGRVHRLDHHGAVDYVEIPTADLARRRLRAPLAKGGEIAIALPRDQALFDGALLLLEADRAIVVRVPAERWLRLAPGSTAAALELGYAAGNLHWRVRFSGETLFVALEGPQASYLARIQTLIDTAGIDVSVVDGRDLPC